MKNVKRIKTRFFFNQEPAHAARIIRENAGSFGAHRRREPAPGERTHGRTAHVLQHPGPRMRPEQPDTPTAAKDGRTAHVLQHPGPQMRPEQPDTPTAAKDGRTAHVLQHPGTRTRRRHQAHGLNASRASARGADHPGECWKLRNASRQKKNAHGGGEYSRGVLLLPKATLSI